MTVENLLAYQFARMQSDGRIMSITPHRQFDTVADAKKAAPDLLATRRGGGQIVLVQVLEVAITTSTVRYEKFDDGLRKKLGITSSERI
jgi:hypothetical protein